MKYWDTSALVPLLVDEPATSNRLALLSQDRNIATWWGTSVECASALHRLDLESGLAADRLEDAWGSLRNLADTWNEIGPSERLRRRAQRLLGVHALRAADALQLAAALVAADEDPTTLEFVSSDFRLSEAARREGFTVR